MQMLASLSAVYRYCPVPSRDSYEPQGELRTAIYLPLVSREWKNGSNSSYNCTPFLHSLLTKGKFKGHGILLGR